MNKINKLTIVALTLMSIISLSNFIEIKITGITVIIGVIGVIGVIGFFINKYMEKEPIVNSWLKIKEIPKNLREDKVLILVFMPLIINAILIFISKLFLPEFIEHVVNRTSRAITFDVVMALIMQLAISALCEEIAWRAFFQKQMQKIIPITPAIIFSSILFSIAHFSSGGLFIVMFDILFIFINSIIYGAIFKKTNNAWINSLSHFIANLFSVIVFMII